MSEAQRQVNVQEVHSLRTELNGKELLKENNFDDKVQKSLLTIIHHKASNSFKEAQTDGDNAVAIPNNDRDNSNASEDIDCVDDDDRLSSTTDQASQSDIEDKLLKEDDDEAIVSDSDGASDASVVGNNIENVGKDFSSEDDDEVAHMRKTLLNARSHKLTNNKINSRSHEFDSGVAVSLPTACKDRSSEKGEQRRNAETGRQKKDSRSSDREPSRNTRKRRSGSNEHDSNFRSNFPEPERSRIHRRRRSSSGSDDDFSRRMRHKSDRQRLSHLKTPDKRQASPPTKRSRYSNDDHRSNSSRTGQMNSCSRTGSLSSLAGYNSSPATTPAGRDNKVGWYDIHEKHVKMANYMKTELVLCGDSIIAGLTRYSQVWNKYFRPLKALNMGIGGDRTQHVLWRAENIELPHKPSMIVLHCGTNNVDADVPRDIAFGIVSVGLAFQERLPGVKIVVTGLLPRDPEESYRRRKIRKVNLYLKYLCKEKLTDFYYMKQDDDWLLKDGSLNQEFYFTDHLHLIERGNEKLAKSILTAYYKVREGTLTYSEDEREVDMSKDDSDDEIIAGRFSFQRKFGERRSKRSRSPLYSSGSPFHSSGNPLYSSRRSRKRRRSSSDSGDELLHRQRHAPYKWTKTNAENTPHRWSDARVMSKALKDTDVKRIDKESLQDKLTKALQSDALKDKVEGTAKSIDISLDEAKRLEARREKFGIVGGRNSAKLSSSSLSSCKPDLDKISTLSKAKVIDAREVAPTELVRRIKQSQLKARQELTDKKFKARRTSLVAYSPQSQDSPSQSQDEGDLLETKRKHTKKFLSDYASNSETGSE